MDYQEPPVYRAAYELTLAICRLVKDCPKDYKDNLGRQLQEEALKLETIIYRVNDSENKAVSLQAALASCYLIRMIIRLFLDLGQMKIETNISLNLKIEEVAKQLAGWKKAQTEPHLTPVLK